MSALQANPFLMAGGDDGYKIERSLRFYDDNSANLTCTTGNATSSGTWTWSGWIKRCELGTNQCILGGFSSGSYGAIYFDTYDRLFYYDPSVEFSINKRFRDVSAWYHLCIVHNASSSITFYANGVQFYQHTSNVPSTTRLNGNSTNVILGARLINVFNSKNFYFHGYMTEINFVDGQALAPTNFGEFDNNNSWQPLKYTGTYGNNGYYLNFSDNSSLSNLGSDSSGNNHNFTAHSFQLTADDGNDSLIDTPTDYTASPNNGGNYATLNPLRYGSGSVSDGNLRCSTPTNNNGFRTSTLGMSSGKWYWEVEWKGGSYAMIGLAGTENPTGNGTILGWNSTSYAYMFNGNKVHSGNTSSYGNSLSTGDIVGVAFDADNGTLEFYRNGTSQGQAYTGVTSGPYFAACSDYNTSTSATFIFNFGQRSFEYTPPTGYLSVCTANLPDPTIADPSEYFDTHLYTGNSSASQALTLPFEPGMMWHKKRDSASSHYIHDAIRGFANNKAVCPNRTNAEGHNSYYYSLSLSGTTLTAGDTNGGNEWNNNTGTYVNWLWKGGSSTVSNTDGNITSQVRANPTAGFSIVSYTGSSSGTTVGHGLNAPPEMIIVKDRDNGVYNWQVAHIGIGADDSLLLNKTDAKSDYNAWNNTRPTSTVFSLGAGTLGVNTNGNDIIAFCFAPVEGYSAFGSFQGGSYTNAGPYVYTGFTPKWVMIKAYNDSGHWFINDSIREPDNPKTLSLRGSDSSSEGSSPTNEDNIDFLSNGFRPTGGQDSGNGNGTLYVYAAFAEHPLKTARAR